MALETATYIDELVSTNPVAGDALSAADDHLRLIKAVLQASFPNISGAVSASDVELSYVDGVTSAIQTQLTALTSVVQNAQNANYTLDLTDANKHIYKSDTTAYAWTIPSNSSKAFPTGTTISFVNAGSAGAITLTRGAGVALLLAGTGADANKTLAAYGWATAMKIGTDTWIINGVGLT